MRSTSLAGLTIALVLCLLGTSLGAVVTDNNLTIMNLGSLSTSFNTPSVSFQTLPYRLVGVTSTVQSTTSGSPCNGYIVDSISNVANQTYPNRLLPGSHNLVAPPPTNTGELNADGTTYGPKAHALLFGYRGPNTVPQLVTPQSLYYNLRVGSQFGFLNWNFSANNIKAYTPTGADKGLMVHPLKEYEGNLVPNASFEDSSVNWFNGGTYVSDPGKHGSQVLRIAAPNTLDRSIGVPVRPGLLYAFSFWYFQSTGVNDTEVQYGLTTPNTRGLEPGNTQVGGTLGVWHEATGTFMPTGSQNTFYISAFANVGYVQFDSIYVAEFPEPASAGVLVIGAGGLLLSRRRS
jgi:hypothetical protein